MRIALLAHLRFPIAEPFKGGMEAFVWHLAQGLAERGHSVDLLASGDSGGAARLVPVRPEHYEPTIPWQRWHGTDRLNDWLDAAYGDALGLLERGGYDVVHNNSLHRYPPRWARHTRTPMVSSMHVPPFGPLRRAVHDAPAPWNLTTVTSETQAARWWPEGRPATGRVVHNGIDPSRWPFSPQGNGVAVWAGRITHLKAPDHAARAARAAGVPLTVFGAIEDRDWFDAELRPLLGGGVRYGGHLSGGELAEELGRASAFLFTPLWDEPFGLAAIEAMACGTPVAGYASGAVAEVVGDGGRLARPEDEAGLARALREALEMDRRVPRRRVEEAFTLERMIDRFEALYAEAADARDTPAPSVSYEAYELPLQTS